jgi:4-amino-4-deoxy-L-arabinose transferase-like glycosyltransferase
VLCSGSLWRGPLNVDEEVTITVSTRSIGSIWHIVARERGGGPLHFLLEHVTLQWPGGLLALRGPSTVFLVLALPAVALSARRLVGDVAAAATTLLVATAPLVISYGTFGRPHMLLFAWLMWGTVLALWAADDHRPWPWALAGLELGASVFVHPTAPVYACTVFAAALVVSESPPRRLVREAWPGVAAFALAAVPYYAIALHALGERYGIGAGGRGRTFSGNPVWEDAIHFLAPAKHAVNYFTVLALGGLVVLAWRRPRSAIFCALTIAAPILFFTVVPTSGRSAIFFDRYMIPTLPAFFMLVSTACLEVARPGRVRWVVAGILVAGLLVIDLRVVRDRRHQLADFGLGRVAAAVADRSDGAILFGTTGSTSNAATVGAFTFGRPANLFERYVSLRHPSVTVVDDDNCVPILAFLRGPAQPRRGLWVFYAARPGEERAAARALPRVPGVTVARPHAHFFVVESEAPLAPRALVRRGIAVRRAWQQAVPRNPRVAEQLIAARVALDRPETCRARGEFGDPDITPVWPLPADVP